MGVGGVEEAGDVHAVVYGDVEGLFVFDVGCYGHHAVAEGVGVPGVDVAAEVVFAEDGVDGGEAEFAGLEVA